MAEISKPSNLSLTWASGGDILDPGTTKYATGWQVEIPPRQWFNFLDNRQDEAIAHINQHGVAVWDAGTEYRADKSFVMGSNGSLYKAITTNTNIDPVSDLGTNWSTIAAFPTASTSQSQALTSNTSLVTPLRLKEAFQGSNQSITGPTNGYQKLPGGLILQWGVQQTPIGGSTTVTFPITFPSACNQFLVTPRFDTTGSALFPMVARAGTLTTSSVVVYAQQVNQSPAVVGFDWLAIGY